MEETQRILGGCSVLSWQRVDGDGLSLRGISAKVKELGGKVATRLTKGVTHIIFQRALGASPKQVLAEDEELRFIYRKVQESQGRLFVVSPLWLRSCETARERAKVSTTRYSAQLPVREGGTGPFLMGTRRCTHSQGLQPHEMLLSSAKEAKFIVPRPTKKIFLDKFGPGGRKRFRKAFIARPREHLDLRDINDPLFSSSQQIRELDARIGGNSDQEGVEGAVDAPPRVLADIEEGGEGPTGEKQQQPSNEQNADPPSLAHVRKVELSDSRGRAAQPQPGNIKRGMRQLELSLFVRPKKPKQSPARPDLSSGGAAAAALQPPQQHQQQQSMAEVEPREPRAEDKSSTAEPAKVAAAAPALSSLLLKDAPANPNPKSLKPVPMPLPLSAPAKQQQQSARGSCAVAAHGGAEHKRPTHVPQSETLRRNSTAGAAPAPLAAAADSKVDSASKAAVQLENPRRTSTPPLPAASKQQRAGAAMQPRTNTPQNTAPVLGPAPPAASAVPTTAAAQTALPVSAPRRSLRSLSGTPVAGFVVKSIGRLTPMAMTPKNLTPGSLVMPKLKSRGCLAAGAVVAAVPEGPTDKSPAAPQADEPAPEVDGKAAGSCTAVALEVATVPAGGALGSCDPGPSMMDVCQGIVPESRQGQKPADVLGQAATAVTASARRSARLCRAPPPTPLPLQTMQMRIQEAPNGSRVAAAAGGAVPESPVLGFGFAEAEAEGATDWACDPGRGVEVDESASGQQGEPQGAADTHQRRLRSRNHAAPVKPLPLSPVVHGNMPAGPPGGQESTIAPLPVPALAAAAGHGTACKAGTTTVGVVTAVADESAKGWLCGAGRTPVSTLRRSTRLRGRSPLASTALDRSCEHEPEAVLAENFAARPLGCPEQQQAQREPQEQEQQRPGGAWAGFLVAMQELQGEASPLPVRRMLSMEGAGLHQGGASAAAAAPADCTPITNCKSRRCKKIPDGEEMEVQPPPRPPLPRPPRPPPPQQQQGVVAPLQQLLQPPPPQDAAAPLSLLKPARRLGDESRHGVHINLTLTAAPSPALCTRSRARGSTGTPAAAPANKGHQGPDVQPAADPLQHRLSDTLPAGREERQDNSASEPPAPPQQPPPAADGGKPSRSSQSAGTSGPLLAAAAAASPSGVQERSGSVTRSRRRALEPGAAGAVNAPPPPHSTAARCGRGGFTHAAALLEAAAAQPGADTTQGACTAAGGDAQPKARGGSSSAVGSNSVAPPCPKPATLMTDPAVDSEVERAEAATAGQGPGGPQPGAEAAPKGAAVATMGSRNPPHRPRTSAKQKRLRDSSAAPGKSSKDSYTASTAGGGGGSADLGLQGIDAPRIGAPSAAADSGNGVVVGTGGRLAGGADGAAGAAAAAKATATASALTTSRPAMGPVSRSRLRLRKQAAAAVSAADPTASAGCGEREDIDMAAASGAAGPEQCLSPQRSPKRLRKMPDTAAAAAAPGVSADSAGAPGAEGGTATVPPPRSPPSESKAKAKVPPQGSSQPPPPPPLLPASEAEPGSRQQLPAKVAAKAGISSGAVNARKIVQRRQASGGSAAMQRPLDIPLGVFRSVVLVGSQSKAGAGVTRPASVCLGAGPGVHKPGQASLAGPPGVPELAPAGSSAGPGTAALAPPLGQYPRGKEHPMRAGFRYLACTQVGEEVKAAMEQAIKKLDGARLCTPGYEDGHITHLVVGDTVIRTLKVLLGIANGTIFVRPSWVTASLAAGEWVPEEQHLAQGAFAVTANAPAGPSTGVLAKPLAGQMVAVHNAQCKGLGLGEVQKKKTELETIVKPPHPAWHPNRAPGWG
ncbi:hypothetical protein VOLCADRAFT_89809 [Volvox carteri f. nagariensis]|uniref:BRCT domain-containing protein n=1 Tax=Volvox carteri f. nagariensis TaxID=3068 RepID=D8TSP8_VOLCA|nr:uncharacterized protein VOLCADRAFT_89809 [Volvox carteri f. nagariensis]EFJ49524.1 hypothetical protein VOLCADRAFT_89809 [Volvox carteri f. nagariensis]|eukprot:XP_002949505.1 hypothetical protein VOLCADRAFT_89809 [Volvox carteri f. nagariensis]